MTDFEDLARSICIAVHRGQIDKGGKPYWMHPFYVASRFRAGLIREVAYLHDVLEDSDVTLKDLCHYGFDIRVINAVEAITKQKNEKYSEYLRRVKDDELARLVKIEDIKHNMDTSRLRTITSKDYVRLEKYADALEFLESNETNI